MRPLTIIGNWKMNGSLSANQQLIQGLLGSGLADMAKNARLALCVPYPYLIQVADLLANSGIGLGAQDVSDHPNGAYTGDVSANMLQELGCQYVIVGHSERRQWRHHRNRQ
jgi:triosephosphate isomerase